LVVVDGLLDRGFEVVLHVPGVAGASAFHANGAGDPALGRGNALLLDCVQSATGGRNLLGVLLKRARRQVLLEQLLRFAGRLESGLSISHRHANETALAVIFKPIQERFQVLLDSHPVRLHWRRPCSRGTRPTRTKGPTRTGKTHWTRGWAASW